MSKIGTSTDKIGALSIMIVKDTIYKLQQLESLIDICNSNNSRIFELAIETCKDLFINYLLPEGFLNNFKDYNYEYLNKLYNKIKEDDKNEEVLIKIYFESNLKTL
jgi:hypothetical protein